MHGYLHLQNEHFSQNLQKSKFFGHAEAQNSQEALKSPFFAVLAENLVIFVLHVPATAKSRPSVAENHFMILRFLSGFAVFLLRIFLETKSKNAKDK